MKTILLLSMAVLGLFGCSKVSQIESRDPVAQMRDLYAKFPTDAYPEAAYNVVKTDSLVNPQLGTISFTHGELPLEMYFHWNGERWLFSKMICTENGKDFTGWGGGLTIMMRPAMRQFLAVAGWTPTAEQEEEYRKSEEAFERMVAATTPLPRGSRSEEENQVDQWDRYGRPINRETPTPQRTTVVAPRATPDPAATRAAVMAEIERKYGTQQVR